MVWDTLQGTTLSQGKQALTGQGHGPDKQTPIWQEMARFGSIFLAGKMCNNNKMVTLLTFKRHAKTSKLPSHIAFKIIGQIKGGLAKPQSSQH